MSGSPKVTQHLHRGKLSPDCQASFSLTSTILGSKPTFLRLQGMYLVAAHPEQQIFYPQQYLHRSACRPPPLRLLAAHAPCCIDEIA